MSFFSKLFTGLNYLLLVLFPFIIVFIFLFFISIFLFKKDVLNVSSLFLLSLSSLFTIISVFLLFLSITITLILPSVYKYTKLSTYIILSLFFFSLLIQQISIIKSLSEFVDIKNKWTLCINPKEIMDKVSCLLTGYMPRQGIGDWEILLIIYGFWLYGFVIPIFAIYFLMKDFVGSSGIVQNENYKKIISLGFAFMAYRGLIVTKLMDFLYIGSLGILMIIINFFAINFAVKKMHRFFVRIKSINEKEVKSKTINELKLFVKSSLSKLKVIPSINLISTIFEDRIRNNLKTIFEAENRLNEFENLLADFENEINKRNLSGVKAAIDKMIAAID